MSMDGRGQRIPKEIVGDGVAFETATCGEDIYARPGSGVDFRRCRLNHMHCVACRGIARRYGRSYSCVAQCWRKDG